MRIAGFRAESDLVGRRIRVSWSFLLEGAETLADLPPVTVRRKTRDWEFPPLPVPGPDPMLVYDSAGFPPPPLPGARSVTDLDDWEARAGDERTRYASVSIAEAVGGRLAEVRRRTTATTAGPDGFPRRQRVELLDTGSPPEGLQPGTTYYYELESPARPADADPAPYRATATATGVYGLNRALYESLPAIYRRHDVTGHRAGPGADTIPEAATRSGQLRRFSDLFGTGLDLLRGTAEGLRGLHDLDEVDARFLPLLAEWIGWDHSFEAEVPLQRNELRSAARLYRAVGTVPALRTLVSRYTGWEAGVAEFAGQIARANLPAQLNIFALAEVAGSWRGASDAAPVLGFGPGNESATGGAGVPAVLTGVAGPFALRGGLELAVQVGGAAGEGRSEVVRFGTADFADSAQATSAEVAAALDRALVNATAVATPGGAVELRSISTGPEASLQVRLRPASLVTMEGAPGGRLCAFTDSQGRVRLFYAAADPLAPDTRPGMSPARIRVKSFAYGAWSDARALTSLSPPGEGVAFVPRSSPASVELAGGDLWIGWVEEPDTPRSRLRFARGVPAKPEPARLVSQRGGAFLVPPDTRLAVQTGPPGSPPEIFTFLPGDLAAPPVATTEEVVDALNARLVNARAAALSNGAIALESVDTGPTARLRIVLRNSLRTDSIGFVAANSEATGAWDDRIAWGASGAVRPGGVDPERGRYADPFALIDAAGTVWLFWSFFPEAGFGWQVRSARWNGVNWSAVETLAASAGGNREPYAARDATDRLWLVWSQRDPGAAVETWTLRRRVFRPGPGTWGGEALVTAPPASGRCADREPAAVRAGADLRVFFRSDRGGGPDLWSVTVNPAGGTTPPAAVTAEPAAIAAPAPLAMPDGLWLLHRADRSVPIADCGLRIADCPDRLSPHPQSAVRNPQSKTALLPDAGTLRRFAGATSVVGGDAQRNAGRRRWDDLLAYSPQRPRGPEVEGPLADDEVFTPGTVGLFVSGADRNEPLTRQNVERLRRLLPRFLPINIRAVVVLAPTGTLETSYAPGAGPRELLVQDDHPFAEYFAAVGESVAVSLPGRVLLLSNTPGRVSANPADLTTLRGRTFSPPPE